MQRRLAPFLVAVLFISALGTAFHRHADEATHNDCPICVTQHQPSAIVCSSSHILPVSAETFRLFEISLILPKVISVFEATRAPPSCYFSI
jgi:hypothetical protein